MASSWAARLANNGAGQYTVTVSRNASLSGGTAVTLPTADAGAFALLPAVLERCRRRIMNAVSAGTIASNVDVNFHIAKNASDQFTGTVKYSATLSGGTALTFSVADGAAVGLLSAALERASRRIKNDYAAGN